MQDSRSSKPAAAAPHPRTLGWVGTTALAMGGSNQMIFIITALFVGQDGIPGQGSASVLLLMGGLLLSWMSAPAWTELVLMWPSRVGGIAAACAEAFRPYSPVLAALTGTCYWWGWVPTCGLTALLSAAALHQWLVPQVPVEALACGIIAAFTFVNLCGIRWVARLAIPLASLSATLAFLSSLVPVLSGSINWQQAATFHLTSPFPGWFGGVTSVMAGLYLIGFAAPAFEAATCHVGETIDPNRNVPRAVLASGAMAGVYFLVLPVVWLGVLGPEALGHDLATVLGPTFAPLLGSFGKAAAIWFVVFNMFHGTLQPLAGAARTLAQLSEDGLLPRFLALRSKTDAPWAATILTAGFATIFLLMGDPLWMIAAANFTYLIGICMPNVAAWLLRRDHPNAARPYRAPKGFVTLGLAAAVAWLVTALLGFQQFGLPTVLFGVALAYSGAALYAWRIVEDRLRKGLPPFAQTLHLKLTGAMLLVLALDGAGYLIAITNVPAADAALVASLQDIFVAVALLSISVGLVLPGMITHSATEISIAAQRLASGTLAEFSTAMAALGRGDLDGADASLDIVPVEVHSRDEIGVMAQSFNALQERVKQAAVSLRDARESLRATRAELGATHASILRLAHHDTLTGLPNRNSFGLRLAEELERAESTGASFSVMGVDLDSFKEANDVFGHAVGDRLLCAVADRLQSVAADAFIARVGGDEFILILPASYNTDDVAGLARRLLARGGEPFEIDGLSVRSGFSIGVARYPRDGADATTLLANADAALYRAKADGGMGVRFFQPEMDRNLRQSLALQSDLRAALTLGQFNLEYQPQVANDVVFGFEALLRWNHPVHGPIAPDVFIPLAERSGLIGKIGEWVLREACREAASWPLPMRLAVNLSPAQFHQDDLPEMVHAVLFETGLTPSRLELEITEGVLMRDAPRALSLLRRLKALGAGIAMDDFGTGYSSLSALKSFPFDKIKIDRSFIAGIGSDPQARAIVTAIIGLGAALKIPIIAEGVETETQREFLRSHGCNQMQGYLIGHPRPIAHYASAVGRQLRLARSG